MMTLLACLADAWVIELSYRIACYGAVIAAAIAALLLLVEWHLQRFAWWPLYGTLVALHPGWPMWRGFHSGVLAVSSDCGYSARFVSVALVLVLVAILLFRLFRPGVSRRAFLLGLAGAGWLLHFGIGVFFRPPLMLFAHLPLSISGSPAAEELVPAVDFGEMRLLPYTFILTLLCVALYIPWHALRRANAA